MVEETVGARSERRFHELSQTLLQLGAYASIIALMVLAAYELQADIGTRVLRQSAAQPAVCWDCRAEPPEEAGADATMWADPASKPPLRRSFASR
jgi:hypothetical protein